MKRAILVMIATMMLVANASAQSAPNQVVTAGETTESPMGITDTMASTVLGAIYSTITHTYQRWVDYAGVNVWFIEEVTQTPDWTLVLTGAGGAVPTTVTQGNLFEQSEAIDLGSCLGCVFDTYECKYNPTSGSVLPAWTGVGAGNCPTNIGSPLLAEHALSDEGVQLCRYNNGQFAADLDNSGIIEGAELTLYDVGIQVPIVMYDAFDFELVGADYYYNYTISDDCFMSEAISGENLGIVPSGTYNAYGLLP